MENKNKIFLGFIALMLCFLFPKESYSQAKPQEAEMAGYLLVPHEKVPDSFNAGFSMYVAAWPLLDK